MRHTLSVLAVMAVMAAMMMAMAAPAFAIAAEGIGGGAGEGKFCNAGHSQGVNAPGQYKDFLVVICPA